MSATRTSRLAPATLGLLALGAALGCGDNLPRRVTLEVESGARLKHARYDFGGGVAVRVREWVFDAERDEPCTPTRWSDGLLYCTPPAAAGVYADADCTTLVGAVEAGPHAPRYLRRDYEIPLGRTLSALFQLGPAVATPDAVWVSDGKSWCDGPRPANLDATYHAPGANVARDRFAYLRETELPITERLAATVLSSADGFQAPATIFDHELAVPCTPATAANAAAAPCEPIDDAVEDVVFYGTADCSVPVAAISDAVPDTLFRDRAPLTGCTAFHTLDDPASGPGLFRWLGDRCAVTAPPTDAHVRALSPPLSLATFERRIGATGARTRAITLHANTLALDTTTLHDVDLGSDCLVEPDASIARCVPTIEAEALAVFDDDACTRPIRVALVPPPGCAPRSGYARAPDGAIHPIRAPRAAPYYDLTTGDRCAVFAPTGGRLPHDVAPALATTAFATGTLAID